MNARALLGAREVAALDEETTSALYRRRIVRLSESRSLLAIVEAELRKGRLYRDADYISLRVTELTTEIIVVARSLRELGR